MALTCNSGEAAIVVVNPVTSPQNQLAHWVNEEHSYFCKRLDGVQTYTLTQETLDKYLHYDVMDEITEKRDRVFALCSLADELLGTTHSDILKDLIPSQQLMVVDDFGHQCKDAGMIHLQTIIEKALSTK